MSPPRYLRATLTFKTLLRMPSFDATHYGFAIAGGAVDELTEKTCNHYRQIVACMLSGASRDRLVIVGWSTANRPLIPKPINDNRAAASPRATTPRRGRLCRNPHTAGDAVHARSWGPVRQAVRSAKIQRSRFRLGCLLGRTQMAARQFFCGSGHYGDTARTWAQGKRPYSAVFLPTCTRFY